MSTKQCIDEANKIRDELINDRERQLLNMVIERLEALPQELTTDELLEEMKKKICFELTYHRKSNLWYA